LTCITLSSTLLVVFFALIVEILSKIYEIYVT